MNISSEGKIDLSDCRYIPETAGDRRLEYGDVLFNNTNSPVWVGKTAWIGADAMGLAYSNHMTRLSISEAANSSFIARQLDWLRRSGYFELNCNKHVNQASISGDFLRYKTPVLLAPLAEQKRIADKLESVLSRVDACRARLDRLPALLKRFRQSVLAAATSGSLTEEWRATNDQGEWPQQSLADLCEADRIITYGVIKLGNETPDGVPCLRTSNVRWLRFDTEGMKRIKLSLSKEYSRTILEGGEVLVNVRGTLGGVAVAETQMMGWNVSREVAVVPVDRSILLPKFLAYWIGSESSQAWLTGVQKGVAYTGINIEDLRKLPVGIPTLDEQQEIVRRVEALFAFAERIETRLATAQKTVERLTPATLAKAFRGELVPQDPNDEPAETLLHRVETAANATPKPVPKKTAPRKSPPTKPKSMDDLKSTILKLNRDPLSFDDLRNAVSGSYEDIREAVFELLAEDPPRLRQEFQKNTNRMQFRIIKK